MNEESEILGHGPDGLYVDLAGSPYWAPCFLYDFGGKEDAAENIWESDCASFAVRQGLSGVQNSRGALVGLCFGSEELLGANTVRPAFSRFHQQTAAFSSFFMCLYLDLSGAGLRSQHDADSEFFLHSS